MSAWCCGSPSAEAWYLWQEVLNGDGEDDDTLSVVAKTRRNLEADVTLFCDVLWDTDLQRVFAPDDREAGAGRLWSGTCPVAASGTGTDR